MGWRPVILFIFTSVLIRGIVADFIKAIVTNHRSVCVCVCALLSTQLVATLPEEWRPGPNFHGFPWEPVLVTMAVGILTFVAFFWRIILAVMNL